MDVLHQLPRLERRARALLGEAPDFVRDDGEALPVLARARGLDGGVQRQQVRHVGELPDRRDEPCDPAAHLAELLHLDRALTDEGLERHQALDGAADLLPVAVRHLARGARCQRGLTPILGDSARYLRQTLRRRQPARDLALLGQHGLPDRVRRLGHRARRLAQRLGGAGQRRELPGQGVHGVHQRAP